MKDALSSLTKSTGVQEDALRKVLGELGLDQILANIPKDKAAALKLGDLRLSVRIGRSVVSA